MNTQGKMVCLLLLSLALSASWAFAQTAMWVGSEDAKLKADRSASSETLSVLAIGTSVRVIATEGKWIRIRLVSGDEGWMYRGKLTEKQPLKEAESDGVGDLLSAATGSRIQADEATTARSIRGLSKETEQYANLRGTPEAYRKALDSVMAMKITRGDMEAFLKAGRIGEYAP